MATKKIYQHLGITSEQYQEDVEKLFFRWCENLSKKNNVNYQCLIANTGISNYFNAQFQELQHEFKLFANRNDGQLDYTQMLENYNMILVAIFKNYPSALIEAASNLKIENPPYAN